MFSHIHDRSEYGIFYWLVKYKISISYKSKVLLHFHIKKYKIKDSNFIISLPLVVVQWIFVSIWLGAWDGTSLIFFVVINVLNGKKWVENIYFIYTFIGIVFYIFLIVLIKVIY